MSLRRRVEQLERRTLRPAEASEDFDVGRRMAAAPPEVVEAAGVILMRIAEAGLWMPTLTPGPSGELLADGHVVAEAGEWEAVAEVFQGPTG